MSKNYKMGYDLLLLLRSFNLIVKCQVTISEFGDENDESEAAKSCQFRF